MLASGLAAFLLAYLPGALLFRLPVADRDRRAALAAEERVFWHVIISLAWSLAAVLALAMLDRYRFDHLLWINAGLSLAIVLAGRRGLLYQRRAVRVSWTALIPIALVLIGLWRVFPASEYIIGGRDPGVYVNEGVQIAQRGSIVIRDQTVAEVPASLRDLFLHRGGRAEYDSLRFMGFFVQDPGRGEVIGQFPHLFPAAIAIGYGVNGLTGARQTVGVWAILGVLAVSFAGARFVGRAAAAAASLLLSLHVLTIWFGRYPNAEVMLQAFVFATFLAMARAHQDGDWFFAPIAGSLLALTIFLRLEAIIVIAAVAAGLTLAVVADRRRLYATFLVPFAAIAGLGVMYLTGPMRAYFSQPFQYAAHIPAALIGLAATAAVIGLALLVWLRQRYADVARQAVPLFVIVALVAAAVYAFFWRHPVEGNLTEYDAYALRTFTDFYLRRLGLVAALAGVVIVLRRDFWRDPVLVATFAAFSLIFFYKIRIWPDHFWMARRFVPVILPGALLFAAAAAVGPEWTSHTTRAWARRAAGLLLVGWIGLNYAGAAKPVLAHVEYAGIIPYLERLAARFTDRDLVIVEARDSQADTHVFALPLAYIYARNVLVLTSARPDKIALEQFIAYARTRHARVLFLGGGGTDLLSRRIQATPLADERVRVPEYESLWDVYPRGSRWKDFNYTVYELTLGENPSGPFVLDIGDRDDLNVVRFHAKEESEGRSIRWTGPSSQIAVPAMRGSEREVELVMHDGGRPKNAPPARVEVLFNNVAIGAVDVLPGFRSYVIALPAALAEQAASAADPAQLRLVSTVWNPRDAGAADDRLLGVMLDRVVVR
jgi:hypothetical protein